MARKELGDNLDALRDCDASYRRYDWIGKHRDSRATCCTQRAIATLTRPRDVRDFAAVDRPNVAGGMTDGGKPCHQGAVFDVTREHHHMVTHKRSRMQQDRQYSENPNLSDATAQSHTLRV